MTSLRRLQNSLSMLFRNAYFWGGLIALVLLILGAYALFNNVLMPSYTRHDASVTVPNVERQPFDKAARLLRAKDLEIERVVQRFNPDIPRDVVVDQTPAAASTVKPDRRIYLTVNTGDVPMVQIPPVKGMSLREARNRIRTVGLKVKDARPDSIPSPYPNTVTRQKPTASDSLQEGAGVTLWYSTGLGSQYVEVPEVTGMRVDSAQQALHAKRLRSVVVGARGSGDEAVDQETLATENIARQSQAAGTRVRAGFEIRLFLKQDSTQAK